MSNTSRKTERTIDKAKVIEKRKSVSDDPVYSQPMRAPLTRDQAQSMKVSRDATVETTPQQPDEPEEHQKLVDQMFEGFPSGTKLEGLKSKERASHQTRKSDGDGSVYNRDAVHKKSQMRHPVLQAILEKQEQSQREWFSKYPIVNELKM